MSSNKRDEIHHHNETKEEKSLPAGTSLTREQSKAPPMKVADEGVISACKKNYGSADPDFLRGLV
jgi:hypothetical protein